METWKKIEGYDKYEVSDWGRVRRGERVLKGRPDKDGYLQVCLSKEGIACNKKIHRLVGVAFIPNPDNKPTINHIDRGKANNHLENLEWATQSEQHIHSPKPIGKSGLRHICQTSSGSWRVQIMRNKRWLIKKVFPTLPEAIKARDEFV